MIRIKRAALEAEFMAQLSNYPECNGVTYVMLGLTKPQIGGANWSPVEIFGAADAAAKSRIAEVWHRLTEQYEMDE